MSRFLERHLLSFFFTKTLHFLHCKFIFNIKVHLQIFLIFFHFFHSLPTSTLVIHFRKINHARLFSQNMHQVLQVSNFLFPAIQDFSLQLKILININLVRSNYNSSKKKMKLTNHIFFCLQRSGFKSDHLPSFTLSRVLLVE